MTDVFQIIEGIELDAKSGIEFTGGQDKYVSALQRFYKDYEENKNKLKGFYEARDYENYMIIVHALKNNAKMIGAIELSKNFEILELAAKEQDKCVCAVGAEARDKYLQKHECDIVTYIK